MTSLLWDIHNRTLEHVELSQNSHATGELMALRRGIVVQIPKNIINDDAFIGLGVKRRGWLVGYEKRAFAQIRVPSRLSDYIIQRNRILKGHKQLLRLYAAQTTTIRGLISNRSLEPFAIISKELYSLRRLVYFLVSSLIELGIEMQIRFRDPQLTRVSNIWQRIGVEAS